MDVLQCIDRLVVLEERLTINEPVSMRVKRVYPSAPDIKASIEHPCFTHSFTLTSFDRPPGQWRIQDYAIHTQFFVYDANIERARQIAAAFLLEWLDALDKHPNLDGTCTHAVPRGGDPTLAEFARGDRTYQGLDMFVDVHLREAKSFPG